MESCYHDHYTAVIGGSSSFAPKMWGSLPDLNSLSWLFTYDSFQVPLFTAGGVASPFPSILMGMVAMEKE